MPAASSALRAFLGKGFCFMPTTTTSLEATAARTSLTVSAWLLAIVFLMAGWICASSRMLRVMIALTQNELPTSLFRVATADSCGAWWGSDSRASTDRKNADMIGRPVTITPHYVARALCGHQQTVGLRRRNRAISVVV